MKIKSTTMGILILVIFTLGIGVTMASGLWVSVNEKNPEKYKTEELAETNNPADIRGSYTFADVSDLFEIDLQVLYQAFNIPEDTVGTAIKTKDLEVMYEDSALEIGNESVRIFVALYKGLPPVLDGSYLPKEAVALILENNKNLTQEELDYLNAHTSPL